MPVHRSHGRPYVEDPRHDELPPGIPADDALQRTATAERKAGATRIPKGARVLPMLGGRATKGATRLSHRIEGGLGLRPEYARRARTLRRALCHQYAVTVGGGVCGVASSLLLKLASEATALAEQALEDGDPDGHRKHADAVKGLLAMAREQCSREAETRPPPVVDMTPLMVPDDEPEDEDETDEEPEAPAEAPKTEAMHVEAT